ncbi:MAG: hypothetical protein HPY85_13270 [Anaerolineae bacterium]|nr:hypothetical protein [Anaerolineae bacterium]
MTEIQCVYCMQTKTISSYSKREHVLPQAFGLFSNNFTLDQEVCDDCNKYFGDNLEIDLARDTFEGLSRFDYGLKKNSEYKSLGRRSRLVIKVAEGQFKGALVYLEYSQETDKLMIRPVKQIGFLRAEDSEYAYFSLDKVPNKSELDNQRVDLTRHNAVIALGMSSEEAKEILAMRGIILKSWGDAESLEPFEDAWNVEVTANIDSTLFRAIAKIAFNYFVYCEGANLARQAGFNTIRSYILYGIQPDYRLVDILERPILADEAVVGRRRLGHLVTINWSGDHKSIVAMVSLFNLNTYSVSLSRDFLGAVQSLPKGHFFNIANRQILPLQAL